MKKKIGIVLFIVLIFMLGISYQVYAKYVLTKKLQIPYTTVRFDPTQVSVTTTKNDEKTATINATATDNGAGVVKYEFYINDELKETVTTSDLTASYSFDYASTFGTSYDAYVIVTDSNNSTSQSNTNQIVDYTINTKNDLEIFRDSVNSGNTYEGITIIQTADIDLKGSETNQWTPIGKVGTYFTGTYNGNDKTISNLYINNSLQRQALFFANNGKINNLTISNCDITGLQMNAGIVGYNNGEIINCANINGKVTSTQKESRTGGIVGLNTGTIKSCYNSSTITGSEATSIHTGGILGFNGNDSDSSKTGTVSDCYNTGKVSGYGNVAGIIGTNYRGIVNSCYNIGEINATAVVNGAITGNNYGTIQNCYYLEGTSTRGGINISNGTGQAYVRTSATMKTIEFVNLLGNSNWKIVSGANDGYPILSWQNGTPTTPQTTAWLFNSNNLNVANAGTLNDDGSITLTYKARQHGPYNTLEAGTYQVRYSGSNFTANVEANYYPRVHDVGVFEQEWITFTDNSLIYTFTISETTSLIEFMADNYNSAQSSITIKYIELIKLN